MGREYEEVILEGTSKIHGETLEEQFNRRHWSQPTVVGNKDIGLFGPNRDSLYERTKVSIRNKIELLVSKILRFILGYSPLGEFQLGLGFMVRLEAEAIPYRESIDEEHSGFEFVFEDTSNESEIEQNGQHKD